MYKTTRHRFSLVMLQPYSRHEIMHTVRRFSSISPNPFLLQETEMVISRRGHLDKLPRKCRNYVYFLRHLPETNID